MLSSCNIKRTNPFLEDWDTPFQTPPFDKIEESDYLPAFETAMNIQNQEIDAIINNTENPSFENTIVALDQSGELLKRVSRVFGAMSGSMNNENMQKISKENAPKLTSHKDNINLNAKLFGRIKMVYENKENLNLNTEQKILLNNYYNDFVRGGANLNNEDKKAFKEINSQLSLLKIQFGENVLKETNKFEMVIDNKDDLIGLPETVISTASDAAKEKGYDGKWLFNITKPSMLPFLQYSPKRELREKLYSAYFTKGDHNDELDNKKILSKIAALRVKKANLLGYKSHADYVLDDNMAKTPDNVYNLLNKLWKPALKRAINEKNEMQNIINKEKENFRLESWDWWYYAEKVKKEKYNLDEDELRPYFEVNHVIKGVFQLATDLFGIQFKERNDIQKYHPDVKAFEVLEANGDHIGILYTDYFPRPSKRGGAWMDEFRRQYKKNGKMITPVIYNVGNLSKPSGDKPALLSVDEVQTLFHEFGHALHGLLSNCTYESLAATETPRDFVEFPSQVMENWCLNPIVLKKYAKRYDTEEVMPDELIEKLQKSSLFNQGFATVEYLAAAFLDMDWHTITEPIEYDATEFEKKSMANIGLLPEIKPRYRSTYYNHIFSGGYSSGYYSYIWSEVLDADCFNYFVESGNVLNKEIAAKYRKYILSKGGTEDSMELYKKFRGQKPSIEPLLRKRGLK